MAAAKDLDPVSMATWARLRGAGKGPGAGKPLGAEDMASWPKPKKKKRKKK